MRSKGGQNFARHLSGHRRGRLREINPVHRHRNSVEQHGLIRRYPHVQCLRATQVNSSELRSPPLANKKPSRAPFQLQTESPRATACPSAKYPAAARRETPAANAARCKAAPAHEYRGAQPSCSLASFTCETSCKKMADTPPPLLTIKPLTSQPPLHRQNRAAVPSHYRNPPVF
jgi:hypothetical protein